MGGRIVDFLPTSPAAGPWGQAGPLSGQRAQLALDRLPDEARTRIRGHLGEMARARQIRMALRTPATPSTAHRPVAPDTRRYLG